MRNIVAAHLLESTGPDSYRFHDLLRLYAVERAEAELASTEGEEAVARMLNWFLKKAQAASAHLDGRCPYFAEVQVTTEFDDRESALTWLDQHRANLSACVLQANDFELFSLAWNLVASSATYFRLRKSSAAWSEMLRLGTYCANRSGDIFGSAIMDFYQGILHRDQGEFTDAATDLARALQKFTSTGADRGIGSCYESLGDVHRDLGNYEMALSFSSEALDVWSRLGDLTGEAWTTRNRGLVFRDLGRHDEALDAFGSALEFFEEIGEHRGRGSTLRNMGVVLRRIGDFATSAARLESALVLHRTEGDRWDEACTLERLGETRRDQGDLAGARQAWSEAVSIFGDLHDRRAQRVRQLIDGQ